MKRVLKLVGVNSERKNKIKTRKTSEKTCFSDEIKFTTEDHFVQHMNITTNYNKLNGKYIQQIIKSG
jgi:hypothetical protein